MCQSPNDECRMSNVERNPKHKKTVGRLFRVSSFGFLSSLVIRHLCSQPVHKLLHRLLLAFDRFHQLKLRPATIQVMAGPVDPEIGVA